MYFDIIFWWISKSNQVFEQHATNLKMFLGILKQSLYKTVLDYHSFNCWKIPSFKLIFLTF